MATDFERALIGRDDMSATQAKEERRRARQALYEILEEGGSYDEVEEMMADEFGLEMDYIMDLI